MQLLRLCSGLIIIYSLVSFSRSVLIVLRAPLQAWTCRPTQTRATERDLRGCERPKQTNEMPNGFPPISYYFQSSSLRASSFQPSASSGSRCFHRRRKLESLPKTIDGFSRYRGVRRAQNMKQIEYISFHIFSIDTSSIDTAFDIIFKYDFLQVLIKKRVSRSRKLEAPQPRSIHPRTSRPAS